MGGMGHDKRVEFKAGRMTMDETMTVRPDRKRGKLVVEQIPAEGITRVKWSDVSDTVTEEYIVFPPADRFCKVLQTEDRVFVLEYSGQFAFYWMQEEDKAKDEENVKRVNEIIGNAGFTGFPGSASQSAAQPAAAPQAPAMDDERRNQLESILEQFASNMGKPGPALHEILTAEALDQISMDEALHAACAESLPEGQQDFAHFRTNLLSP
jgi:hypothetical protein